MDRAGVAVFFFGAWAVLSALSRIAAPEGSVAEAESAVSEYRGTGLELSSETPVLWRDVDYSEGRAGDWFPAGESPLLEELVEAGELPPVEQRVGSEPLVLEGVDGIGRYGGTWYQADTTYRRIPGHVEYRNSGSTFLRWSPRGYPLVPHVAKAVEARDENREFIIRLRKGMRWSDGHPYTADDILYWWEKEVQSDAVISNPIQNTLRYRGKVGTIEKLDRHTVRIRFEDPHGIFRELLATWRGIPIANTPKHYLAPYHPVEGDPERIKSAMEAFGAPSRRALYQLLKEPENTEHPRLWPWVYRTYKANAPLVFVRNPYYFAVDPEGNQLPYLDRMLIDLKAKDLIGVAASYGEFSLQTTHISFGQYSLLMSERDRGGYDVHHWPSSAGSSFTVHFNLNRRVPEGDHAAALKRDLLREKRFRQAMSFALNREALIQTMYGGLTEPSQAAPPPDSPFYYPPMVKRYIEFDPERANRLLDALGLTQRDVDGFRTFPDGTPMHFFLETSQHHMFPRGLPEYLVEDWARVGVRVTSRRRAQRLYSMTASSGIGDLIFRNGKIEYMPLINPELYVPLITSSFAPAYGKWYQRGGLHGHPDAKRPGALEPPKDHPLRRAMELYDAALQQTEVEEQARIFSEVMEIAAENAWTISVSTPAPAIAVVHDDFHNVPRNMREGWEFLSPANGGIETFYTTAQGDSEGAIEQLQNSIRQVTPMPGMGATRADSSFEWIGSMVKWLLIGFAALGVGALAFRHPLVARRLGWMVPTLLTVSVVVFVVIELPPGSYLSTYIAEVEESGRLTSEQEIEEIERMFKLDRSPFVRYADWMGFRWFATFDQEDRGLLQGDLGRSMATFTSVNSMIGDRLLLTLCIGIATVLFTWLTAIPIGIYSAVKQYTIGDYIATFIGFFGMCVPNFLLALLLMYFGSQFFGVQATGLFSPEYAGQPEWTWGKVADLLKNLWVPVLVIGVGGTAQMIRIMRANLLDELKKPYVVMARSKGVRPFKLLMKYPVRLALNPFVSGLGTLFPQLVSGGTIVALVLSLPTIGPLLLEGLLREDMYLAGSMLLILSLLGIIGTLVSDLLLLALDPRIRMEGGGR